MALSRFVLPYADVGAGIRPSSGAKLFFYASGTSTFKSTFTDATGSTANTNPVIANANGVFPGIFLEGVFNVALKDANDVQIWTEDPYSTSLFTTPVFSTVAAMVASTPTALDGVAVVFTVGMFVSVVDYATGNNSGVLFGSIVAGGTGTADGGSYIDLANGLQWKQNFLSNGISVKQFGATGDSTTNESAYFQNAVNYFSDGSEASITVTKGTYNLITNPTYSSRSIAWLLNDGATVTNLQSNDTGVLNASAVTSNIKLSKNTTEMGHYIDVRMRSTTGTNAYEKDGLLVIAQTDDDSTTYEKDCVGIGARGYISSTNTNGRAWGLNAFSSIAAGGDGLLVGIEINLSHSGTDNSVPDTAKAKYGLNITTKSTSENGTAAIIIGTSSNWHRGIWTAPGAFVDSSSRFITLHQVFSVDIQGRVSIGTEDTEEQLHVYKSSGRSQVLIQSDGSGGEASTRYTDEGTRNWTAGLWFDTGRYTISPVANISSGAVFEIDDSGNFGLNGFSPAGGSGVVFIANASVVPPSNPTGGGVLYTQSGALKYKGSSGTVTILGAA
jgi:hypothetical protein